MMRDIMCGASLEATHQCLVLPNVEQRRRSCEQLLLMAIPVNQKAPCLRFVQQVQDVFRQRLAGTAATIAAERSTTASVHDCRTSSSIYPRNFKRARPPWRRVDNRRVGDPGEDL